MALFADVEKLPKGGFLTVKKLLKRQIFSKKDVSSSTGWYDNEWGYSNRVVDLVRYIVKK